MSTPTNCRFCGATVAHADPNGSWVAFTCLTTWHRGRRNQRSGQMHDCRLVEIDRLTRERDEALERVKRLEVAVEAAAAWSKAREAQP